MRKSRHAQQRMSQRGINKAMIEMALMFGAVRHDRYVLGRKEAAALLNEFQRQERVLRNLLDRGGQCAEAVEVPVPEFVRAAGRIATVGTGGNWHA